jgi:hypothetical protein
MAILFVFYLYPLKCRNRYLACTAAKTHTRLVGGHVSSGGERGTEFERLVKDLTEIVQFINHQ